MVPDGPAQNEFLGAWSGRKCRARCAERTGCLSRNVAKSWPFVQAVPKRFSLLVLRGARGQS